MEETWSIKGLIGLYLFFILIDLLILPFDGYFKEIRFFVLGLFIMQLCYLYYLNNKSSGNNYLLSLAIAMITGVIYFLTLLMEKSGIGTILSR